MLQSVMIFTIFMEKVDKSISKNVLDKSLEECSTDLLTGWLRDGCCNTDEKIFDVFY
mgnify:CR=1 FL=1